MRVAIDARTLQGSGTGGVGRGLVNVLPRIREQADVELLLDDRGAALSGAVAVGLEQRRLRAPLGGGTAWLQLAVPRFLRGYQGVFHCPFYWLPYVQPVPMVVTIHDLTFEHHPQWFSPAKLRSWRLQARHAARSAAAILTVSEASRTDILEHYRVDPRRVLVAPNAVAPAFLAAPSDDDRDRVLDRLGVRRPYVLALGGAPRRNLDVAEAAWRRVSGGGRDIGLVVVGGAAAAGDDVRRPRNLTDEDLVAVMGGAEVFCYATGFEGFGLPAVEALAAGVPVVCARVGALPEVLGDAAEWCAEPSAEALAAGLAAVLDDAGHAHELRRRGRLRVAAMPTWEQAADTYLRAYRLAAGDG
jgi:alpha-1,3-rhamnosyl/mannosyltransferase